VAKWPSGSRVILDMTASLVNVDIDAPKFKYKCLAPFVAGITRDTWICKRDIDSAFLRLAVRPEDYRLCCFYHKGAYWCFMRLPFGAASAPFLFCRVADAARDAFIKRWSGVFEFVMSSFSDDSFLKSQSYDDLLAVNNLWGDTLTACGLTPSIKQGKAVPSTKALDLLGVYIDVTAGFVPLPEAKRVHYFPLIDSWLAVTITRNLGHAESGRKAELVLRHPTAMPRLRGADKGRALRGGGMGRGRRAAATARRDGDEGGELRARAAQS
jgi:hypothetical protein